ncbi:hypothetical protein [Desulfosarcina ovata]|uniref:hypothetical protein n=1 Tax=Desulfosarcina ovata TaxID=83564 RepID=UPI0012D2EB39|nr:hypothetical protein [Desulfosarcina ovata]
MPAKKQKSIQFKIDFILHLTFDIWHLAFSHFREWCVFRNGRFLILLAIALGAGTAALHFFRFGRYYTVSPGD